MTREGLIQGGGTVLDTPGEPVQNPTIALYSYIVYFGDILKIDS